MSFSIYVQGLCTKNLHQKLHRFNGFYWGIIRKFKIISGKENKIKSIINLSLVFNTMQLSCCFIRHGIITYASNGLRCLLIRNYNGLANLSGAYVFSLQKYLSS